MTNTIIFNDLGELVNLNLYACSILSDKHIPHFTITYICHNYFQ